MAVPSGRPKLEEEGPGHLGFLTDVSITRGPLSVRLPWLVMVVAVLRQELPFPAIEGALGVEMRQHAAQIRALVRHCRGPCGTVMDVPPIRPGFADSTMELRVSLKAIHEVKDTIFWVFWHRLHGKQRARGSMWMKGSSSENEQYRILLKAQRRKTSWKARWHHRHRRHPFLENPPSLHGQQQPCQHWCAPDAITQLR